MRFGAWAYLEELLLKIVDSLLDLLFRTWENLTREDNKMFPRRCLFSLALLLIVNVSGLAAGTSTQLGAIDVTDLPLPIDSLVTLEDPVVSIALEEQESFAFTIQSAVELRDVAVELEGLPHGVEVETYEVTTHRRRVRGGKEITTPYFLDRRDTVTTPAGDKALYYLTFSATKESSPGTYQLKLKVGSAQQQLHLHVRPFRLRKDPEYFFGAFCGRSDVSITSDHLEDLAARGFDALQFFWGSVSVDLANENGSLEIDFSRVDRWMEDFKAAGLRGPVVWSMGNDSNSHLENRLAELFSLPKAQSRTVGRKTTNFADIYNPRLNELVKQLMLAIKNRAEEKQWPEIAFIIYDEPTERLMEEHEHRYDFLKSFWPELRIYGVTMNRIEWAEDIQHMVDIFVANGDFAEISQLGKRTGKPFWLYGSGSSRDGASLRHRYAWTAWAHDAGASWFWAYNYGSNDPYDDFDGRLAESTARMVWPPRKEGGPIVVSVSWDGMREAADDMKYIKTLEWMLAQTESSRAEQIKTELTRIKSAIPEGRAVRVLGGDEHDTVQELQGRKYVVTLRQQIASWIEEMLSLEPTMFGEIRVN